MRINQQKNIIDQIELSDTTQREGRQSQGAHLTPDASLKHASLVDSIGIDYIELNHPASSPTLANIIRKVTDLDLKTKITTHVRCNRRDIQVAIESGVKRINTYIPIKPNSSYSQESINNSLRDLSIISPMINNSQIELRVSVEHALSLPLSLLKSIYKKIADFNCVRRLGIAETTGVCFPDKLKKYAKAIYDVIPKNIPIQFHLHNDHGLAAANFLAILELIAKNGRKAVFDISIAGFGERNGILSYGDVLAIFYTLNLQKLKERYRITNYALLVQFIEEQIGLPFCRRDPLNPWAFSHSAGPHLDGMINGDNAYQAIKPEDFGFRLKLNIGHCVTGYQGLQYYANKIMKISISDSMAKEIAALIREEASLNGPLTDEQVQQLIISNSTKNICTS